MAEDLEEYNRKRIEKGFSEGEKDVFEELKEGERKEGNEKIDKGEGNREEEEKGENERKEIDLKEALKIANRILRKRKKSEKKKVVKEVSGKEFEEIELGETEIVKPKRNWNVPEIPVSEKQEKIDAADTEIVRPRERKPFTVPIKGKYEKKEETDIYYPEKAKEWIEERRNLMEREEGTTEEGAMEEIDREEIKKQVLEKSKYSGIGKREGHGIALSFLEDGEGNAFIGRKKSVLSKYGNQGALYLGKVAEQENEDKNIFLDSLNPHVVFVCGARGSGKCLTGDTLITLEDGTVRQIKELEGDYRKVVGLNHSLKIEALQKNGFYKRTVEKVLKVLMRSGKSVTLTPEHPLLTIEGWKQAQELGKGSRIATPRRLPFFGKALFKECDVKILAYLLAEGHLSNQFVLFSNSDSEIIKDFFDSVKEFDSGLKISQHSKPYCFRVSQKKKKINTSHIVRDAKGQFTKESYVVAQKSSIMQWLEELGIYGKLSVKKFVPEPVFKLNKQQLSVFLNRLFSCDGSIYRISKGRSWNISYATSSEKLAQQVQHLLLRFGIISRIRAKKVETNEKIFQVFQVEISGKNVLQFLQEIGFYGEKQQKQEIALQEMQSIKRNTNIDTIPKEVWNFFKVKNWAEVGRKIGYLSPKSLHSSIAYSPSREKLAKLAEIEENKGIQILAESDIFWDEIKEVQEINKQTEVYDIEVSECHNFVANDVIVHNSYVLGIVAEELALKNNNVGIVVIDPIGVFWSMKYPNREEKELEAMARWNIMPQGLKNLKVFIPEGVSKEVPKNTFDATFSMQPSLLTSEDWCLTFGIERFSPTGLLLEKALKKVEKGFKTLEEKTVKGKGKKYSLDDLIFCLEKDSELNSREKGYKQDSVRALVSRFEAAKSWGIFDEKGTPLASISREGQLTVMDTSFLDDNVTALVIGILARRLLAARKISTRKESAKKFKDMDLESALELEVPPTWLFIDEAHTLIPSGNVKTPATSSLVEYVKQGRRPGLSLVFATQQPSAIDTKVLSQLDVILSHKLIFDDDIKAVYKRTPTIIPNRFRKPTFLKTLPIGVALAGDRTEETTRAFVLKVRPRLSQHEGRDATTIESAAELSVEELEKLALEMAKASLEKEGLLPLEHINALVDTLNTKYKGQVDYEKILKELEKQDFLVDRKEQTISVKGFEKPEEKNIVEEIEESIEAIEKQQEKPSTEETELVALPASVMEVQAKKLADKFRQKKLLGVFGKEEKLKDLRLQHRTIYRVKFNEFNRRNEFAENECFVDSVTGEFVHFKGGTFLESKGLKKLYDLKEEEVHTLLALKEGKLPRQDFENTFKKMSEKLVKKGIVGIEENRGVKKYFLKQDFDLPKDPKDEFLTSMGKLRFVKAQAVGREQERYSRTQIVEMLQKLWPNVIVKKIDEVNRPVYEALYELNGKTRAVRIDAVTGRQL